MENLQVKHIAFGVGTILSFDGKYMRIKFDGCEKNFVYPDAFEKFLTLVDGTVSDAIKADLAASKEKKEKIIAAKNEENLRAMTRGIVIPGKEGGHDSEEEEAAYNKNSNDSE